VGFLSNLISFDPTRLSCVLSHTRGIQQAWIWIWS